MATPFDYGPDPVVPGAAAAPASAPVAAFDYGPDPVIEPADKLPLADPTLRVGARGMLYHAETPAETSRFLGDRAVDVGRGLVAVPQAGIGILNIPTMGAAGKLADAVGFNPKRANDILDSYHSDAHKAAQEEFNAADGVIPKAVAVLENPEVGISAATESLPSMAFGGAVGRVVSGVGTRLGVAGALGAFGEGATGRAVTGVVSKLANPVVAGAVGEGVVAAGQSAEQIRTDMADTQGGWLTPTQSLAATADGVLTTTFSVFSGKIAKAMGIPDVDAYLAGSGQQQVRYGLAKRVLGAAVTEGGLEELPQSMVDQIAQNFAENRPLSEGLDGAAVLGFFTGAGMGGGFAAVHGGKPHVNNDLIGGGNATPVLDDGAQPPAVDVGAIQGQVASASFQPTQAEIAERDALDAQLAAALPEEGQTPANAANAAPGAAQAQEQGNEPWRQPVGHLDEAGNATLTKAYEGAAASKPEFDSAMNEIATATGTSAILPDLKGRARSEEKIANDYGGDATRIKDLLRGTIQADTLAEARSAIESLQKKFDVVEIKDALDPAKPSPYTGGYRDAKLIVRTSNGTLAEIQVNLSGMMAAKKQAHALYAQWRTLDAKVRNNGNTMSAEEMQKAEADMAASEKEQAAIYAPAWERSLSNSERSMAASAPGLNSSDGGNARGLGSNATRAPLPSSNLTSATGVPSNSKSLEPSGGVAGKAGDGVLDTSGSSSVDSGNVPQPAAAVEPGRVPRADLEAIAKKGASPGVTAHVVDSYDHFPAHVREQLENESEGDTASARRDNARQTVKAASDGRGNIYLAASTIGSHTEAAELVAHETTHEVANAWARENAPRVIEAATRDGGKASPRTARALASVLANYNAGELGAGGVSEEILAHMAEDYHGLPGKLRMLVHEAIAAVRKALRKLGAGLKMNDSDILAEISKRRRKGIQGKGTAAASAKRSGYDDTAAFKRWFKSSKVVDENGDPMIVYHGTRADFSVFADGGKDLGFHFGTDFQANNERFLGKKYFGETGGRIMPVYLSIQNPLRMNDVFGDPYEVVDELLRLKIVKPGAEVERLTDLVPPTLQDDRRQPRAPEFYAAVKAAIKAAGYDGIVYENNEEVKPLTELPAQTKIERSGNGFTMKIDGHHIGFKNTEAEAREYALKYINENLIKNYGEKGDSWIAFDPTQIKSASGNSGAFDASNPDIRAARRASNSTLNIGLSTAEVKGKGQLSISAVKAALKAQGVNVLDVKVHGSDTEPTAVVTIAGKITAAQGNKLSQALHQEAIVQRTSDGNGALFGPKAKEWGPYNPEYFVMPDGKRANALEASARERSTAPLMKQDPAQARTGIGLKPGSNKTRSVGEALNNRVLNSVGKIDPEDRSAAAAKAIGSAMADEIKQHISANEDSGLGWYSHNYPRAVKKLARIYPELAHDEGARAVFTALLAVTSNGEKVRRNLKMAMQAYEAWRSGASLIENVPGSKMQQALNDNFAVIHELLQTMTGAEMREFLLEEMSVKEINAELRANGKKPSSSYSADTRMPRAALFFGPKLGAFFANLSGSDGFLTMDLWWTRTFNRMRGNLVPQPTQQGLARLRELLDMPNASDEAVIEAAVPYWRSYSDRNYKNGSELEKAANTVVKAARMELNQAPKSATERKFMIAAAKAAQEQLRAEGIDLAIADIQAALWYYEKRLYSHLGTRLKNDDIGYEEAINEAADAGDRRPGRFAPSGRGSGGNGTESSAESDADVRTEAGDGSGGGGEVAPRARAKRSRGGWNQRPQQPDAVTVEGVHYSNNAGLDALSGTAYGSNHRGGEYARLRDGGRRLAPLLKRVYFYPMDADLSKRGESMVGRRGVYEATLSNIYDYRTDPRNLWAAAAKAAKRNASSVANEFELQVIKAGFDGYRDEDMAVVLGVDSVPVDARQSVRAARRPAAAQALGAQAPKPLQGQLPSTSPRIILRDHNVPALQRWIAAAKAGGRQLKLSLQDRFLPVQWAQDLAVGQGRVVDDSRDANAREQVYYGRVGERLRQLKQQHIEPIVEAIAKNGVSLPELELYMYARFAPSRNAAIAAINKNMPDGGSGMTNADAAQVLADFTKEGKTSKLEAVAQLVYAMNAARIDLQEGSGLIDAETAAEWRKEPLYVPLKGLAPGTASDGEETFLKGGKGFSIGGKESHMARGRKSRASDLLANAIAASEQAITRSERNRVMQSFMRMALENPNPELWEIARVKAIPVRDPATGEIVEDASGDKVFMYQKANHSQSEIISVKVKGKEYALTIHDRRLADALKNTGTANLHPVVTALATIGRYLSITRTTLSPEFVISNFARDIQTAVANLSIEQSTAMARDVVKDIPAAMRTIFLNERGSSTAGKFAAEYQEFLNEGAKTDFANQRSVESIQKELVALGKTAGSGGRRALRTLNRFTLGLFNDANTAVENAVRLAAFINARKSGMTGQQAAVLAKNLTVNFNKKGQLGPFLNSLYMFFNASVQGNYRFFQAMFDPANRNKVAAFALSTAALGFMLSFWNAGAGGNDDDGQPMWDKIPDFEKNRNMIVFLPPALNAASKAYIDSVKDSSAPAWIKSLVTVLPGGHAYFKLPMPYAYNTFFNVGAAAQNVTRGKSAWKQAAGLIHNIANNFNPFGDSDSDSLAKVLAPTLIDPIIEIEENRNFFGGPIRPEQSPFDKVKDPDSEQYFPSTNPIAIWVAQHLNSVTGGTKLRPGAIDVSPTTLEYEWNFVFAGTGSFLERTITSVGALASGGDITTRKVPFLRTVYGQPDDRRVTDTYYTVRDDANLRIAELEAAMKDGTLASADSVQKQEFAIAARLRGAVNTSEAQLRNLRAQRKIVDARKDIDEAERERLKTELEKRMRAVQLRFNTSYFQIAGPSD